MIANSNKKISVFSLAVVLSAAIFAGGASIPQKMQKATQASSKAVSVSSCIRLHNSKTRVTSHYHKTSAATSTPTVVKNFIKFINKAGYDVIKGSMKGGMTLSLPKNAKLPYANTNRWKFLMRRNTFSKRNGLDFSPYFGKKIILRYCDGKNRKTGETTELVGLYSGSRLVGFWAMPRLKNIGLPNVSYKYNRDSSVLKFSLPHSVYKSTDWDDYLIPWDEYSTDLKDKLCQKAGYRFEVDGRDEFFLTIPKSFNAIVKGYKVGAYLKACNKLSKHYGYDFSAYLGKRVTFNVDPAENVNTHKVIDIFSIYYNDKLIGFWLGSDKSWRILDFNKSGLLK